MASYDVDTLRRDFAAVVKTANRKRPNPEMFFGGAPPTFVEPGLEQRWIFDYDVAARVAAIVQSLAVVANDTNRRLLRVLLGDILPTSVMSLSAGRDDAIVRDGTRVTGAPLRT